MDTNSLLSQDEIDSLFKQATGKSVNRSPAAETEQPAPVITPVQSAVPTPQAEIIRPAAAASQAAVSPKPAPPVTAAPRNDTPVVLKRAAPPAAPPAQRPPPQPVPVAAETNDDQNETNEILLNISERLSDMERRLAQLERSGAGRSSLQGALQQSKVERLSQQFRGLAEAIQVIQAGLKNTPDYNLRAEFVCEHCGSHGAVNTRQRCSKCGNGGWWGWWPPNRKKYPVPGLLPADIISSNRFCIARPRSPADAPHTYTHKP